MVVEFDARRAFAVVESLAFPRLGGTDGEKRALELLAEHVKDAGLAPVIEEFPVTTYASQSATVECLDRSIPRISGEPRGLSGSTPEQGVEGPLVFVETGFPEFVDSQPGAVLLTYRARGGEERYRSFVRAGAKAVIEVIDPGIEPTRESVPLSWPEKHGELPMCCVSFADGMQLLESRPCRVRVTSRQRIFDSTSHNLLATIPGSRFEDQAILICAHFDGTEGTNAVCDNATGTAIVLELLRHFAATPPRRTVHFAFFGSEELGLLGSLHYAMQRRNGDLDELQIVLNLEACGCLIGEDLVVVSGGGDLPGVVRGIDAELAAGNRIETNLLSFASDHLIFNALGVPSLAFERTGGATQYFHTHQDERRWLDAEHLGMTGRFALTIADRFANSIRLPFDRTISQDDLSRLREFMTKRAGIVGLLDGESPVGGGGGASDAGLPVLDSKTTGSEI